MWCFEYKLMYIRYLAWHLISGRYDKKQYFSKKFSNASIDKKIATKCYKKQAMLQNGFQQSKNQPVSIFQQLLGAIFWAMLCLKF